MSCVDRADRTSPEDGSESVDVMSELNSALCVAVSRALANRNADCRLEEERKWKYSFKTFGVASGG